MTYLLQWRGDVVEPRVSEHEDAVHAKAKAETLPEFWTAHVVDSEADLKDINKGTLLKFFNQFTTAPLVKFDNREMAAHRTYLLLKDAVERKSSPQVVQALAFEEDAPRNVEAAPELPGADETNQEEANMAAKRTQKSKSKKTVSKTVKAAPKAKTAKPAANGHDAFGLRSGSKASQAAALFARAKGATMAEVKEAIGDSKYNLLNTLKAAGHKVKKEGLTIFLTAK